MGQPKEYLAIGDIIEKGGEGIVSPNRCWEFFIAADGVLKVASRGSARNKNYTFMPWNNGCPFEGKEIAILQQDGNFVCYKERIGDWRNALWATQTVDKVKPPFFLMVEDTGQVVLYKGNSPDDKQEQVWSGGGECKVEAFNGDRVEYDVSKAIISKPEPLSLYSQLVTNDTDIEQVSSISGSVTVVEQKNWSTSISAKTGFKVGTKFTTPFIKAEVSAEISVEVGSTETEGGSKSESVSYGFNASLKVKPRAVFRVEVVATKYKFTVPYNIVGYYYISNLNDKEWAGAIPGVFSGDNAVNYHVIYREVEKGGMRLMSLEAKSVKDDVKVLGPSDVKFFKI